MLAGNGEEGFKEGRAKPSASFARAAWRWRPTTTWRTLKTTRSGSSRRGAVRSLAGSGEAGFADGQGAAARFNLPLGLARDKDGSILVADRGNNAVRRVTREGEVSTVAGNGEAGYADGEGAAARFNDPLRARARARRRRAVRTTSGREAQRWSWRC